MSDPSQSTEAPAKKLARRRPGASSPKRRCVSNACIACRKRKSKCDGVVPSCAACSSVYGTECVYDPNSDHRRRGVYKDKVTSGKPQISVFQVIIDALRQGTESEAIRIVRRLRASDDLDELADKITRSEIHDSDAEEDGGDENDDANHLVEYSDDEAGAQSAVEGERDLARKMGELRLENGSVRFIGGTSHLIYMGDSYSNPADEPSSDSYAPGTNPITTWTRVTDDPVLIAHLINKYFCYHYPYFTTLSKKMFERDYYKGRAGIDPKSTVYCSSLLVNAMLALGCHFSDISGAYGIAGDSRTKGNHFFAEAKRLIVENDEYEKPRLVTVQALALMSVREAGCGREAKGWVYSGMSFRMAQDIGLNLEMGGLEKEAMNEYEIDARRVTFWGCYLFDKCWSNYLGRLPQLSNESCNVPTLDVFPDEEVELWCPFPDSGPEPSLAQPSRTRAAAVHLFKLCEISNDLLVFFYHPNHIGRSSGKGVELKKLSELHRRLEQWRKDLPQEFQPKERQLPNVILTHMFFNLQYIHLFRPFLKYSPSNSPLPSHVSPRRICTANAGAISKLMRLYKRSWGLRQICNIAVYMIHSACIIHLLNLPEKTAKRDITHGIKHLEEMAEDWLCARRTLSILSVLARKWKCELPEDAAFALQRADETYGYFNPSDVPSPMSHRTLSPPAAGEDFLPQNEAGSLHQPTSAQGAAGQPSASTNQSFNTARGLFTGNAQEGYSGAEPASLLTQQQQPQEVSMSGFTGSFSPGPASKFSSGMTPNPTNLRQAPLSGAGMENPDWFFNDGVRWQQSFETWEMGNRSSATPNFVAAPYVFGDDTLDMTDEGGRVLPQQSGARENLTGFEGFDATLNQDEWLSNLD
ncbi:unnamed protein product [Clonostachys rhizophaga]|uniref:Zn(2)-C6 fungal-type domain-containing protein n=1 Tax=Clonostachys rhizophaga TaxID=160324 RepID=A0A9N9VE59_9HYPO|nr:unnamed protein product [Clonostachys rhizophaga]